MKSLKALYDDGEESFVIDFTTNPDKLQQVEIAKSRGAVIEVMISTKTGVRTLLSSDIKLEN